MTTDASPADACREPRGPRQWPRLRPRAGSLWLLAALTIAAAVAAPLAVLVAAAFDADLAHWRHLAKFVLPHALVNTLLLLAGVGAIT